MGTDIQRKFFKNPLILRDSGILFLLWLGAALVDRLWSSLDQSVPAWDQGDHLTRALHYWQTLQYPQLFSGDWWTELWRHSPSYRSPFVYLATVPFLAIFGQGYDQATLVNLAFTACLLVTVYCLGKHWFDRQTGLWAAGLTLLAPSLVLVRTDYLLDYGLAAVITFTFASLTAWRDTLTRSHAWWWSLGFGVGLGLTFLTKPTGLLFLLLPTLWAIAESLVRRKWERVLQLGLALLIAWLIFGPWFSTNWLTIISSSERSNSNWVPEGVAPGDHLAAWLYYWRHLPTLVSYPLLLVPLGCWLLAIARQIWTQTRPSRFKISVSNLAPWPWILGFLLGTYGLLSLLQNKDPRHILPFVPIVMVALARGLTLWPYRWHQILRWGTVGVATGLILLSLFPLPGAPHWIGQRFPYRGQPWPHEQLIAEVIQAAPYLRSTIGVLSNTAEVNAFNVNFHGTLANFQVYGRDLGFNPKYVSQDGRSLTWYLTKTANQGVAEGILPAQAELRTAVEQSPDLQIQRIWNLPDGSELRLHRQQTLPVTVQPILQPPSQVQLTAVNVAPQAAPGFPVPVTYQMRGRWSDLRDGLVLLTWEQSGQSQESWLHDHGIGLGQVYAGANSPQEQDGFEVTEHLSMLPPASLSAGTYRLQGIYLNRRTGATYPLALPITQITLDPQAPVMPAPELDLVTQLRQLAGGLPQGELDPIFETVGQINQYDPLQDYLVQAEQSLTYRLQQDPTNLALIYNLAIAHVLQRHVNEALEILQQATQVDPQNPYAWAYLGFIHLYRFQPRLADAALAKAEVLNPHLPNLKILQGAAAALQLNVPRAWEKFQAES